MFIPVSITPFNSTGMIDVDSFDSLHSYLASKGAKEFWVFGTGGEDWALSKDDRLQALKSSSYANNNKSSLIVGIGNLDFCDSKIMMQTCLDLGFNRFHFMQRNRTLSVERVFEQLYDLSCMSKSVKIWGYFSDNYSRKLNYDCLTKVPKYAFNALEGIKYSTADFYSLVKLKQELQNLRILPAKAIQIMETLAVGFKESTSIEACIHFSLLAEIIRNYANDLDLAKKNYADFREKQILSSTGAKVHNFMNIAEVKYILRKKSIIETELVSSDLKGLSLDDTTKLDAYLESCVN